MEILARRIIELREELDLSSEKIAQRLGTSHKTVINWEKNRGDPSLENLMGLARLFSVTPDYLVGLTDERTRTGEDAGGAQAGERTETSDEVAVRGDARKAVPRPTRRRRGSSGQPES